MSAPAFTPGPWTTGVWKGAVSGSKQHYGDHAAVFAPSGEMVCPCGLPDDPDNIPNARLIAAAPRMYDALEETETTLRILVEIAEDIKLEGAPMIAERLSNVGAVLREARGEQ